MGTGHIAGVTPEGTWSYEWEGREREKHRAAFPNAIEEYYDYGIGGYISTPLGCGRGLGANLDGQCLGYELAADIDFDTNGDGRITAADHPLAWNGGAGWDPIVRFNPNNNETEEYAGHFRGNGYTISNMMINTTDTQWVGLFERLGSPGTVVDGVNLVDVDIRSSYSYTNPGDPSKLLEAGVGGLAGVIACGVQVRNSSVTGKINATFGGQTFPKVGGLAGFVRAGDTHTVVFATWADVDVTVNSTADQQPVAGGLAGHIGLYFVDEDIIPGTRHLSPTYVFACYALGDVKSTFVEGTISLVGGLFGAADHTILAASYAAGRVENERTETTREGLHGLMGEISPRFEGTANYWDVTASGFPYDPGQNPAGVEGKTTAKLQGVNGYTGIYAGWQEGREYIRGNGLTPVPQTTARTPAPVGLRHDFPIPDAKAGGGPHRRRGHRLSRRRGNAECRPGAGRRRPPHAGQRGWRHLPSGGKARAGRHPQQRPPVRAHYTTYTPAVAVALSEATAQSPTFTAPSGLTQPITLGFGVTITTAYPHRPDARRPPLRHSCRSVRTAPPTGCRWR